jgi:hypothetical protein
LRWRSRPDTCHAVGVGQWQLLDLKGPSHAQAHTADLPADAELVLPERVTVVLTELAGAARKGLRALA